MPSGYLVGPIADPVGPLTQANVRSMVSRAVAQAERTRAAIRLPLGSATRMVIAVAGLDGTLLAVFRMPDATVFSIDVAASKARNVVYFSSAARNPGDMRGFPRRGGAGRPGDGRRCDAGPGGSTHIRIRADRVIIGDVRLPFFKLPRNPEVR